MNEIMKTCRTCEKSLPLSDFGNAKKFKDGVNIHCFTCSADASRARKNKRLDNMTIEEMEQDEAKRRQYKKGWDQRNPEQRSILSKRSKTVAKISPWTKELSMLKQLLEEYEQVARPYFEETGTWMRELVTSGLPELSDRWSIHTRKLAWLSSKLNGWQMPYSVRDTVIYRIAWLTEKLDATTDSERAASAVREESGPVSQMPRSLEMSMAQNLSDMEAKKSAAFAALSPNQRAESLAMAEAKVWVRELTNVNDETLMSDVKLSFEQSGDAEAKRAEWRRGDCSMTDLLSSEKDADTASGDLDSRVDELRMYRYWQVLPGHLDREMAAARRAEVAKGLFEVIEVDLLP